MSEQPNEAKHTPGPWIADVAERIQGQAEDHRYDIARLCPIPFHIVKGDGSVIRRANARLIAAAPELLAACEAVNGRVIESVQISCPDGKPGCCVSHTVDKCRVCGGKNRNHWNNCPVPNLEAAIAKAKEADA